VLLTWPLTAMVSVVVSYTLAVLHRFVPLVSMGLGTCAASVSSLDSSLAYNLPTIVSVYFFFSPFLDFSSVVGGGVLPFCYHSLIVFPNQVTHSFFSIPTQTLFFSLFEGLWPFLPLSPFCSFRVKRSPLPLTEPLGSSVSPSPDQGSQDKW